MTPTGLPDRWRLRFEEVRRGTRKMPSPSRKLAGRILPLGARPYRWYQTLPVGIRRNRLRNRTMNRGRAKIPYHIRRHW